MSDGYIHIVGWDKFQHGSRENPWIKDYVAQLHKDEYLELSAHLRGILHDLRLIYAASHRQVRDNTATLKRQLGYRVVRRDIERLCDAGFIEVVASSVLAQSRVEENREEKNPPVVPPPPAPEPSPPASPPAGRRDLVWDFVVEQSGEPLPGQRRAHGRVSADLRALLKRSLNGATETDYDAELRRRHGALADEFGEAKATMRSLVNHWDRAGKMADGLMRPPADKRPAGMADRLMAHSMQLRQQQPHLPELEEA